MSPNHGLLIGDNRSVSSSRYEAISDEQWARIEPLLPSSVGRPGRRFENNRRVVEAIIYRYRTGIPWRDLPVEAFGSWKTAWKRHRRYAQDGTWDKVLAALLADADAAGKIDWTAVSVDATINRAHQHATNTVRPDQDTGGPVELHKSSTRVRRESARR
ncbi:IS5 family transposase [Tsukamurella pseudospumae]|uniref:IS5 family transposase n=1 Tax=Tsukamurella pseudospumae TaxID=239498 RepID=UPI002F90F2E6